MWCVLLVSKDFDSSDLSLCQDVAEITKQDVIHYKVLMLKSIIT